MPHAKVTGGLLDEPYPIKSRADINRARVLPLPRDVSGPAAVAVRPAQDLARKAVKRLPKPSADDDTEQPKSGFDYVVKRNRMLKRQNGRTNGRANGRR